MQSLDMAELKRMFEERMKEQKGRHQGGSRWIGTGGTSPFGAHGQHPSGLRVGQQGGGRSAMGVADARRFRPYRSDLLLDVRQIEVALRKLRAFQREGQPDELDLEGTIDATAKNAGELEILVRPPRKSNVRVLLLMDVGGSMDPHIEMVSRLFSAAKRASNIRSLKTYYFHNCVYARVYETERFSDPVRVDDLLHELGAEWKLVIVGDAAMHPAELLGMGDYEYYATGQAGEPTTGHKVLAKLADHFRRSVWLNPDPPTYWRGGTAEEIAKALLHAPAHARRPRRGHQAPVEGRRPEALIDGRTRLDQELVWMTRRRRKRRPGCGERRALRPRFQRSAWNCSMSFPSCKCRGA